jgi:hypothetical protein
MRGRTVRKNVTTPDSPDREVGVGLIHQQLRSEGPTQFENALANVPALRASRDRFAVDSPT